MKKIILVMVLALVFITACTNELQETDVEGQDDINVSEVDELTNEQDQTIEENNTGQEDEVFNWSDVIAECDSLCNVDSDMYCEELRTIEVNDTEVTGSCRAFSRKGNVPGFSRCEEFCKEYEKSGAKCVVGEETDKDCDGIADQE